MQGRSLSRLLVVGLVGAVLAAGCRPDTTLRTADTGSTADDPPGSTPPLTGRYVAMGSSMAAGPGIGPDVSNGCGRSARNYPRLLAARLGLDLTDVTCSGATTANLASTAQGDHPPQLDAVTAGTRLVTITAGGNDLGYAAATARCAQAVQAGKPCTMLPTPDQTAQAAAHLHTELVQLLKAIGTTAPNALVYLVSYPRLFPNPPATCAGNVISTGDSTTLAAVGATLDTTFRLAAADARVALVDVYSASTGHDVCADPANRWVEGSGATGIAYHPDANGAAAVAALVEGALRTH